MNTRDCRGFTLIELLVLLAILAVLAALLVGQIKEMGERHPATIESYKAVGIVVCERLYGNAGGSEWAACVKEVLTEAARAHASREAFDKGNVPSIPPADWP